MLVLLCLAGPGRAAAVQGQALLSQHIQVSFDLDQGMLRGTSRITIPENMGTCLDLSGLGHVELGVTSAGKTLAAVEIPADGRLCLDPAATIRHLEASWTFRPDPKRPATGRIAPDGIALLGAWHPRADADMFFELEARLPQGFTGISEGDSPRMEGDVLHAAFAHALPGISLVAGPYVVQSTQVRPGLRVFSYFFAEDQGLAARYRQRAAQYLRHFEDLLGPSPLARFSIVENRLPTGHAMPGFTLLGQAVVRLPFILDTSLGHEVAHAWLGNGVLPAEQGGNWCEGLVTLLADLDQAEARGEGALARWHALIRHQAWAGQDRDLPITAFQGAGLDHGRADRVLRAVGYDKTAMVLFMLRERMGEAAFNQGLRAFVADNLFQRAGWPELRAAFEAARPGSGALLDQWLERRGMAVLALDDLDLRQDQGRGILSLTLRQGENPLDLLVPLRIQAPGETVEQRIELAAPSKRVDLALDMPPHSLALDPDYRLPRMLERNEYPPVLARLFASSSCLVVRGQGAEALEPLVSWLARGGCATREAAETRNQDLLDRDILFAGDSAPLREVLARMDLPEAGLALSVRLNPLNADRVMVLAQARDQDQCARAMARLRHYGLYQAVAFTDGRAVSKTAPPLPGGMTRQLSRAPAGVAVRDLRPFEAIVDDLLHARVIYVGETHTDPAAHLLQQRIIDALWRRDPDLAIGMEMFPADRNQVLQDYIQGRIGDEAEFLRRSEYFTVWGYDWRLYRDIIGMARRRRIPVIGLNLRKSIVSQVFRDGHLDGLDAQQRASLPPRRDLGLPGYTERLARVHAMHAQDRGGLGGFIQAQALWDESMARAIAEFLQEHPTTRLVVLAGSAHVYKDSAIPPRVARRMDAPQAVVLPVSARETGLDEGRRADYLFFSEPLELPPAGRIGVLLEQVKEPAPGLRITGLSPHGKAGEAGLRKGDIILAAAGRQVPDMTAIRLALMDRAPGETIRLRILRQRTLLPDREMEVEVELSGSMP